MEFVGLALGVYPVVILAFEQFKTGAKYFSNWRRFRRRYEGFIRDVEAQQLLFEGNLQDLLCGGSDPYLDGIRSKGAFLRVVCDKSYAGWSDPKLADNLKSRLGQSYDWYMYTIQRIYDIFKEFEEILDIHTLQSSNQTPDWWKYQWERVKKSLFDKKINEKRETAARLIEELTKVLELSNMEPQAQRMEGTMSAIVPFLNKIRINAINLHNALKKAWHCHCNCTHKALLQLERRDYEREMDFNVLFVLWKNQRHGFDCSEGEHAESEGVVFCIERDVQIKVVDDDREDDCDKALMGKNERPILKPSPSAPAVVMASSFPCPDGSTDILPPPSQLVARSVKGSGSLQSLENSEIGKVKFFQGLKLWGLKSRPLRKSKVTILSHQEEKELREPNTTTILNASMLKHRWIPSIYSARLETRVAVSSEISTVSVISSPQEESRVWGRSHSKGSASPEYFQENPANSVQEPPSSAETISNITNNIIDLCAAVHDSVTNAYIEYLIEVEKQYLRFLLGPKIARASESSISLYELLEGDSHRFPPAKRVMVATILTSSLLQLQRTPWINNEWSKHDVFFRTRDGVVIFEQLYFSSEFASSHKPVIDLRGLGKLTLEKEDSVSAELASTVSTTSNMTKSTLTVGTSAMSSSYSSINPFHLKTVLECLGIVLIELCLGEPIERGQDKVSVRPHGPLLNKPNHDFCLAIANAWTWEEISEYEPSFSDPIQTCLRFPNLGRAKQGRYDEMLEDMYLAIVKPLQDEMSRRR